MAAVSSPSADPETSISDSPFASAAPKLRPMIGTGMEETRSLIADPLLTWLSPLESPEKDVSVSSPRAAEKTFPEPPP